jgi:Insertion element 4 transposase N-terminal
MYPQLGYARVWAKLTAGLAGMDVPCPSEKALRAPRRRLGPAPLKAGSRWSPARWLSLARRGCGSAGCQTQHAASEHPLDKPARPLTFAALVMSIAGAGRGGPAVFTPEGGMPGAGRAAMVCL